MKNTVRSFAVCAIALAMAACMLSGCQSTTTDTSSMAAGTSDDEVLTYEPVDQDKMLITVRTEYNIDYDYMEQALESRFPNVDFVFTLHWADDPAYELRQTLENDQAEDIVLSSFMPSVNDIASTSFLDTTGYSFASAYDGTALENCQISGRLYYLPGPSDIYGIVYDKTMFEQNGWQVPTSYSEFVQLCNTIDATGIRAFQPTFKSTQQTQLVFTAFSDSQVFGSVAGSTWLASYQNGTASMQGNLEPAFARFKQLADAGIIRAGDFDMRPGNRSIRMYTDNQAAMIVENQLAKNYAGQFGSTHEYAMMPFWSSDDANGDRVFSLENYDIAANADLNRPGNEAKRQKVLDVLDYISTPEGQRAIAGGSMTMSSSVKNTPTDVNAFNQGIQATIAKGNLRPETDLMKVGWNNDATKALQSGLRGYMEGTTTAEQLMAACDAARDKALSGNTDYGSAIGTATGNFTRLQTGLFIADAFKNRTGADIGLSLVGQINYGTLGRIYEGDITAKDVSMLSLMLGRSVAYPADKKLWTVSMTGSQIRALLKEPYTFVDQESFRNTPYYVASGLNITFAPWKEGDDKLVSVTMADGTPLQDDRTYTVALWAWPFQSSCPYPVQRVYDESYDTIIGDAIAAQGTISPITDDRFTLVWDR